MNKYLLGIDNGGTVIKASIFDTDGNEIAVAGSRTRLKSPEPGFSVRDMNELRNANFNVIREVIKKSGVNPEDILCLSITGHGNGLYLIDENGMPIYDGIYSSDNRAQSYVSEWYMNGVFDRVHPKIMQAIWAGQPVALLAWLKENQPDVLDKARWILMCKDYIRYCLTGEVYAEITDLSGSNLMNVRDSIYDKELLKEFGLDKIMNKLPPIKYSTDICGFITPEAEDLTGLKAGTPVAGGMFDIDACAIATGITNEEKFSITAGTWSINQYITKTQVLSKDLFLNTIYCNKDYCLITEASPTCTSNLEWFVDHFLEEEKKLAENSGKSIYEVCNGMVGSIDPCNSKIIFLPFLFGTNVEIDSKACFIGLKGSDTKADLLRSVYEGVVFSHLYHFEKLMAFRSRPKAIQISGGAAKSEAWVRIFADAFQIPFETISGTELGALGAAICAGVAVNEFESYDEAVSKMVVVSDTIYPDKKNKEIYSKKYSVYKSILKQLAPVWAEL